MEEMEQQGRKNLDDLIKDTGGPSALRHRTGISLLTIREIRYGRRRPFIGTAAKMAGGLGVDVSEIDWPRGYVTDPAGRAESPKFDLHDLYEDKEFKAAVAREVERQIAGFSGTAAQTADVQTAAQSAPAVEQAVTQSRTRTPVCPYCELEIAGDDAQTRLRLGPLGADAGKWQIVHLACADPMEAAYFEFASSAGYSGEAEREAPTGAVVGADKTKR